MTKETVNTNFELPEQKTCSLYVESLTKEYGKRDNTIVFYRLKVVPDDTKNPIPFSVFYFKSQMAELLKALGVKEIATGKFEFDTKDMNGKWITARITHEKDKTGTERVKLVDIKPYETPNPSPIKSEKWDNEEESPAL